MRLGDKNLEQFEKEFDVFLDSFSDEELINTLKKYLICEQTYYIKNNVLIDNKKVETMNKIKTFNTNVNFNSNIIKINEKFINNINESVIIDNLNNEWAVAS